MLGIITSFITINIIYASHQGTTMIQALGHITEMANSADSKYTAESRRILKSVRRDLARRRRQMKNIPSTNDV